jgi:Flp pilus assembly protein protease CpaA
VSELLHAPWQAQLATVTLFAALAVSAVTDLQRRRILNAVTFPALAICFGCFFWLGGLGLVFEALVGAVVCGAPFVVGFALRAVGAGDVKLMLVCGAVAGAAAGWPFAATVMLYVSIAGGAQALAWLVFARLSGRERPRRIPYGLAIAVGTLAAFAFGGALV